MDKIPTLLLSIAGTVTRHALTGVFAYLTAKGWVNTDDAQHLIAGAGLLVAGVGWGLYQKYKDRLRFLVALQMPEGTSESEVKAEAKKTDISPLK